MRPEPPRALLIAAPPLGGATRLAWALGQTAGLQIWPQMALGLADDIDGLRLQAERAQSDLGHGLLRALALRFSREDSAAAVEQARQWLWRRGEQAVAHIVTALTSPQGCAVWPDEHLGWRPDYVDRALALDGVGIVHLVRAPRVHVGVLAAHFSAGRYVPPVYLDHCENPSGRLDPQLGWCQFHGNLLRAESAAPGRYLRVQVEAFLHDPVAVVQMILAHFGLRAAPGRPPGFGRRGPDNAPGGVANAELDDAAFFATATVRDWQPPAGWQAQTDALARRLGCGAQQTP